MQFKHPKFGSEILNLWELFLEDLPERSGPLVLVEFQLRGWHVFQVADFTFCHKDTMTLRHEEFIVP